MTLWVKYLSDWGEKTGVLPSCHPIENISQDGNDRVAWLTFAGSRWFDTS